MTAGSSPSTSHARASASRSPKRPPAWLPLSGARAREPRRHGSGAPLPGLLRPARSCHLLSEGWQHGSGLLCAEMVERLECLVGEIDRMAAVDKDVIGDRGTGAPDV